MLLNLHRILTTIVWLPIIVFTGLLTFNTVHYFIYDTTYGFLAEKQAELQNPLWAISFYVHIATATVCLMVPVFQFLVRITKATHRWHVILGRGYVWSTLLFVCPTGTYMALFAKGGLGAQTGFMAQGILLAWFTWKGYQSIKKHQLNTHVEWMVRSYAIATAALTFRLYHLIFIFLGLEYNANYTAAQWISVVGNLLLAEFIISYIRSRRQRKAAQPIAS